MFKLIITLINHQNGERRQLVHNGRYKNREEAWKQARKMTYVNMDTSGRRTYECAVKVVEA
ncbi:TPA: hypothetical protein I8Y21_005829 [Klebsiella oxytoca]|uniref:Uncharacterized protein n=1 Tax=Klebsiella oxytoca TaxID=571 RepID=A0AAN5LDK8_KLEOX|nr:hypothetical protein [Klebsiella oxytoca]